jgi:HD-GYP domain-containing protein (c-di-GMP phosphodiesterase class II)
VRAHHERVDGRGYPDGLVGTAIPAEARVLAVADAYEAMTADRPYRRSLPPHAAEDELRRAACTQFDRDMVDALIEALADGDEAVPSPV